MKVKKAVITSAGLGSRMKYITSVLPKALLPIFKYENGKLVMRTTIDYILEKLQSVNVNDFCVVVGKHGKLLMDYLYERQVTFVIQKEPKGFGDAVLKAENFVSGQPFFVHADDGVLTGGYIEAKSLFEEIEPGAVLLLKKVENPSRYGVITPEKESQYMNHVTFRIKEVEEKPQKPKSNIAIKAVYIFSSKIFDALKHVEVQENQELELTFGIQEMINQGEEVYGILLENEKWLNVGDPKSYYETLKYTYEQE